MKKSIILLLGLVLLFAIPTLASTPEDENAPAMTSEDQQFMGLTTISEEELMGIEGNVVTSYADGASPITSRTIKDIEKKLKSFDWRLKESDHILHISYEQNSDGTYTITITTIGITTEYIISGTDFLQIEIYAASHNMEIQGAILNCWIIPLLW